MSEKSKNVLLGVLIVGLVSMTVAYAALSTALNITGTASVPATTWDIRLSNLTKAPNIASVVTGQANTAQGADTVNVTNGTQVSGLAVTLNQPGDKIVYNFTISNLGTIDAKLSSFTSSLTKNTNSATDISDADIASKFTHSIVCNPTQATTTTDYLNKAGQTAGTNHDVANCTLTIQWNEAGLGTGQRSQTAGEDQTYTQGAVTLDYTATWVYIQK